MAQGFIVLSLNNKGWYNLLFHKSNKIFPYVDITQHRGLSLQKSQRGRTVNEVKSTKLEVTVKNICRAALSD